MILLTDFVALGCLVLALTILQKGVRPKSRRFHQFLLGMWALTVLLWVSALYLYWNQ